MYDSTPGGRGVRVGETVGLMGAFELLLVGVTLLVVGVTLLLAGVTLLVVKVTLLFDGALLLVAEVLFDKDWPCTRYVQQERHNWI